MLKVKKRSLSHELHYIYQLSMLILITDECMPIHCLYFCHFLEALQPGWDTISISWPTHHSQRALCSAFPGRLSQLDARVLCVKIQLRVTQEQTKSVWIFTHRTLGRRMRTINLLLISLLPNQAKYTPTQSNPIQSQRSVYPLNRDLSTIRYPVTCQITGNQSNSNPRVIVELTGLGRWEFRSSGSGV